MDDITPATRRMTYAELGEGRGISPKSAERLAQRRRWPRQIGNDGMARVVVPIGEDRVIPRRQGVTSAPDIGEVVGAAIRDVVAPLSAQLEHERARADRAEEKAGRLQAELVELRVSERSAADLAKYATGEATDLRQRLDAERARCDQAERQLVAVEGELIAARVEAAGLRCRLEQARPKPVPDSPRSPWRRFLGWRRWRA